VEQGGVFEEARRASIERRIDDAAERSAAAREDTRARVDGRLRYLRDVAGDGASVDSLEAELGIVEAQLDLDDAANTDAFVQAARRVLAAYGRCLDAFRSGGRGSAGRTPAISTVERLIALTEERLDRYERAVAPSGPSRTRVLVALDDLERTFRAAVADGRTSGGGGD
jgi:hypothetical protein